MAPLLEVDRLSVSFDTEAGLLNVVDDLSFELSAGESLGLVGESGCGKSVSALAIMGLLPKPSGRVDGGDIRLAGESLLGLDEIGRASIRGRRIAMIYQEPMTALNPVQRIGQQLAEARLLHEPDLSSDAVRRASLELLDRVGIPAPESRLDEYPHELSGGMRQRVVIAMALACKPEILIADEPTTALDVTIQAQILQLLRDLQSEYGMAMIFITHDLGVIAELTNRVIVMYAGRLAESADVVPLFGEPRHPYTRGLLTAIPRLEDEPKTLLPTIQGMVPTLADMPPGCRFSNRCEYANDACTVVPPLEVSERRAVACHHWREIGA
tara:strand:- start:10 stop:987 length:978 start_codon:yes stop_codon:yes gene_type:complete